MSALRFTYIVCDYPGCLDVFDDSSIDTAKEQRKEAKAEYGWGAWLRYDFCTKHMQGGIGVAIDALHEKWIEEHPPGWRNAEKTDE